MLSNRINSDNNTNHEVLCQKAVELKINASAYFGHLRHLMGSLALLARDLGHKVTGSDLNVYPPMSTQLENAGITLMQGDRSHLQPHPDLVIVGNAMKRGIDAVEYMLNQGLPYISGPQFLADHVSQGKHVLGAAGTHKMLDAAAMRAAPACACRLSSASMWRCRKTMPTGATGALVC